MEELKFKLKCGIEINFTDKLDETFNYVGTFEEMLEKYHMSKNYEIRNSALIEIENRAIRYAHKRFSVYTQRCKMANESVKLLMAKIIAA